MIYIFYQKRKKIQLIRPLLNINRFEVFKLSSFWLLPVCVDPTNKFIYFRRNRLRYQVFPILRTFFNPQLNNAFFRYIETLNSERQYFDFKLHEAKNVLQIQRINFLNIKSKNSKSPKFFTYLPVNLQKKFYRQLLISYFKNITFTEIDFLFRLSIFYIHEK